MVVAGEDECSIFFHTSIILFVSTILQNTYNEKGAHYGFPFHFGYIFYSDTSNKKEKRFGKDKCPKVVINLIGWLYEF